MSFEGKNESKLLLLLMSPWVYTGTNGFPQNEVSKDFILAGLLVIICFGVGTLMSARDEQAFGHTLVLAASIFLAGLLISLAISGTRER